MLPTEERHHAQVDQSAATNQTTSRQVSGSRAPTTSIGPITETLSPSEVITRGRYCGTYRSQSRIRAAQSASANCIPPLS